jgi:hypothetical protein
MHISSYLKAVFVLLLTFLSTVLFALMLVGVLELAFPENLKDDAIGFFLFVLVILFAGTCAQYFAKYFLYDKDDRAELQMLGGIRFGNLSQAIANGTGATWPFAKLSASQETLKLQTPFGNYTWEKADPWLIIQRTGLLPGRWKIGAGDAARKRPIVFSTLPWKIKMIERKLKELGYRVRSRTRAPDSSDS